MNQNLTLGPAASATPEPPAPAVKPKRKPVDRTKQKKKAVKKKTAAKPKKTASPAKKKKRKAVKQKPRVTGEAAKVRNAKIVADYKAKGKNGKPKYALRSLAKKYGLTVQRMHQIIPSSVMRDPFYHYDVPPSKRKTKKRKAKKSRAKKAKRRA